jgi:hypothetical protein
MLASRGNDGGKNGSEPRVSVDIEEGASSMVRLPRYNEHRYHGSV